MDAAAPRRIRGGRGVTVRMPGATRLPQTSPCSSQFEQMPTPPFSWPTCLANLWASQGQLAVACNDYAARQSEAVAWLCQQAAISEEFRLFMLEQIGVRAPHIALSICAAVEVEANQLANPEVGGDSFATCGAATSSSSSRLCSDEIRHSPTPVSLEDGLGLASQMPAGFALSPLPLSDAVLDYDESSPDQLAVLQTLLQTSSNEEDSADDMVVSGDEACRESGPPSQEVILAHLLRKDRDSYSLCAQQDCSTPPSVSDKLTLEKDIAPQEKKTKLPKRRSRRKKGVESMHDPAKPQPLATTMVLQRLPACCSREALNKDLVARDLGGTYDFFYLPTDFKSKRCLGYAIVNFKNHVDADRFRQLYAGALPSQVLLEGSRRTSACGQLTHPVAAKMEVGEANLQGLFPNMLRWLDRRRTWTKDRARLPVIIYEGKQVELQAETLPPSLFEALPQKLQEALKKNKSNQQGNLAACNVADEDERHMLITSESV